MAKDYAFASHVLVIFNTHMPTSDLLTRYCIEIFV